MNLSYTMFLLRFERFNIYLFCITISQIKRAENFRSRTVETSLFVIPAADDSREDRAFLRFPRSESENLDRKVDRSFLVQLVAVVAELYMRQMTIA